MSNYPLGVTGREPQISGGTHTSVDFECESRTFNVVEAAWVIDELNLRRNYITGLVTRITEGHLGADDDTKQALLSLRDTLTSLQQSIAADAWEGTFDPCPEPIREEVNVLGSAYEVRCPRCGTLHVRELPEP